MKKLICLLLSSVMLLSLLQGCASEPAESTPVSTAEPTEETTVPPADEQQVRLRVETLEMQEQGETFRLYNGIAKTAEVTFGSENEAVATFENGMVVCQGEGSTVVFAEYEGHRVTCTVTCAFPSTEPATEAATEETTEATTEETTEAPTEATEDIPEPQDPDFGYGGGTDPVLAPPTTFNVDSSFFDDAVFIGDSVSVGLKYYAESSGALGNAQFLVRESYGIYHASNSSMTIDYNGISYSDIVEAVAATGASKVFLMLGVNDMVYMGMEDTVACWRDVLNRLQAGCPGIRIYIESCTPIYTDGQTGMLTNERMDTLNMHLMGLATEYGATFLNIAPYLKDGTGGMADRYCSDNYVHLTFYDSDSGTGVWVKAMKHLIPG